MPSYIKKGLALMAPALLGLLSGIGGALYVAKRAAAPEASAAVERVVTRVVGVEQNQDLARQVDDLRTLFQARQNQAAKSGPSSDQEKPISYEEVAARNLRLHDTAIQEHRQEPRDPSWAPGAERSLRHELDSLPELGATAFSVDCRMTTCTVDVEWPSYAEAVARHAKMVEHPYSLSCGREMLVPPPEDPQRPYRATAVFRCESARTQGG